MKLSSVRKALVPFAGALAYLANSLSDGNVTKAEIVRTVGLAVMAVLVWAVPNG